MHWVFAAVRGLSLVAASRGYSLAVVCGFLVAVASPVAEHRLYGFQASVVAARGHSSCDLRALKCRLGNWRLGLVAP